MIFATEAEFTDLCIVFMLAVTVYFLVLDEKKNKLISFAEILLSRERLCDRGKADSGGMCDGAASFFCFTESIIFMRGRNMALVTSLVRSSR